MALTPDETELIRNSFRVVSQDSQQAANRFYRILFERSPHLRHMFLNDMEQQGGMLMSKLGLIVAELQNIPGLVPVLEDLALRHVAYGVKPQHYPLVGDALLQMLAEMLAEDFTPATRAAWVKAYDDVSRLMIRSAYSHEVIPAET
ncbi:globin domain-containing protein [Pelagibius sp.]|uniref:globin domain-containing protein n=1 Tax=Pelagibius sp. TaxID=1931238 RepID=UPI00260CA835|nr:globin domain-containing protein [Pelagibius sp.]